MPAPALVMQTTYAELLQRCSATAFQEAFPENGTFISKTIKGKRYWYFQQSSNDGRAQRVRRARNARMIGTNFQS